MKRPAYALATILILLGVAMFGAGAIVTISRLESKISRSSQEASTAYYVAEAGVQDAMWRLNNDVTYSGPLADGTLNASYTATNFPATGQNFTVTMVTDSSLGAGYGTIDVVGTSNNGDFTASRHVQTEVFKGSNGVTTNGNAFFSAGKITLTNVTGTLQLNGGGIYSSNNIALSNAKLNTTNSYDINAVGTYTTSSSTVTTRAIHSTNNNPPAATLVPTPSFNFTDYSTSSGYTVKYTPAQFQNLFCNACAATVNLSGVVYVSGAVSMPNSAKNKTLNMNGMLVIAGNFTVPSSVTTFTVNVTDPGTGKSGIFVSGATSISVGNWTINGVMYTAGNTTFALGSSQGLTINGALISGGTTTINASIGTSITYNDTRVSATVGNGPATALELQHWEEEY